MIFRPKSPDSIRSRPSPERYPFQYFSIQLYRIPPFPHTPISSPSGPAQRPIQEPPAKRKFLAAIDNEAKVLVISPDGRESSAIIHQDADVWRIRLRTGDSVSQEVRPGRGVWLQLIKGSVTVNETNLSEGEAASSENEGSFTITALGDAEALLFDRA